LINQSVINCQKPFPANLIWLQLLQLKLELDSCHKFEDGKGCCLSGLPMLNPRWIINATSKRMMDFNLDQEFTQNKKRKLILTESEKI